jgi:hypothetical protein
MNIDRLKFVAVYFAPFFFINYPASTASIMKAADCFHSSSCEESEVFRIRRSFGYVLLSDTYQEDEATEQRKNEF